MAVIYFDKVTYIFKFIKRVEWLWKERLKGEEEGVETMQGINRVLLENLLPAHVARHFLTVIKVNSLKFIEKSLV